MNTRPIRVVLAKPGLDGHDRGAKVVARGLRDSGIEVIYTGVRCTPSAIVRTASDEDADAVLLSILSGAHLRLCELVCRGLHEVGMSTDQHPLPVVVGGIIPDDDIPTLRELGVTAVFQPGAKIRDIVAEVHRQTRPVDAP